MPRRGLARLAPLVLVVAAGLSACSGEDADPPASTQPATTDSDSAPTDSDSATTDSDSVATDGDSVAVTVTREGGEVTPSGERVELGVDETLLLTVTADEAGELHVHSTPEQEIAYEEGTSEHEITIDRPGVVEVESHDPHSIVLQLEVR